VGTSLLNNENNQRVNGTSWGEIGFSAARNLFENENKFSVGTSLKLLFQDRILILVRINFKEK
jgi:hypothetical protein